MFGEVIHVDAFEFSFLDNIYLSISIVNNAAIMEIMFHEKSLVPDISKNVMIGHYQMQVSKYSFWLWMWEEMEDWAPTEA